MRKYIALLRGINVSGQKKIKMAELQSLLEEANFQNVKTYLQSGNILLESDLTPDLVCKSVERVIHQKYNFEVPCLIKTHDELIHSLEGNLFLKNPEKSSEKHYFTFLWKEPSPEKVANLQQKDYRPEEFLLKEDVIYFYAANGYGRAKMNNNFFENKLKVMATTRNLKTVNALIEMSS